MATESDPLLNGGPLEASSTSKSTSDRPAADRKHRKVHSVDFMGASNRRPPPVRGLHRKHNSSVSALLSRSLRNLDLTPIQEEFTETAQQIQTAFRDNVQEVQNDGFLDVTLTRSMSILPDDLDEFVHEVQNLGKERVQDQEQEGQVETTATDDESSGPGLAQYLSLIGAVVAVSSNATALHLLNGVSAPLKFFWRMTASHLFLFLLAAPVLRREGLPELSLGQWMTFFSAVFCYSVQGVLFLLALESTTISNALMFANSQALLLIIGKAFVGVPIHVLEGIGVFIAFIGALLCCHGAEAEDSHHGKFKNDYDNLVDENGQPVNPWDPTPSDDEDGPVSSALVGDILALCSAVAGIGYLTFAKAVRPHMNVSVFLWSVMLCGSMLVLLFLVIIDRDGQEALTWDTNQYTGVIGWISPDGYRIPIVLYLAVVVTGLGTKGFVTAMAYFSTVMIAVVTLLEPMLASLIATAMGVGHLPGPFGWAGNLLVAVGTLSVVAPSMNKSTPPKSVKSETTLDDGSDEENFH